MVASDKFWRGGLQSLCDHCHNSRKDVEWHGYDRTVGEDGLPLDPLIQSIAREKRGGGGIGKFRMTGNSRPRWPYK